MAEFSLIFRFSNRRPSVVWKISYKSYKHNFWPLYGNISFLSTFTKCVQEVNKLYKFNKVNQVNNINKFKFKFRPSAVWKISLKSYEHHGLQGQVFKANMVENGQYHQYCRLGLNVQPGQGRPPQKNNKNDDIMHISIYLLSFLPYSNN